MDIKSQHCESGARVILLARGVIYFPMIQKMRPAFRKFFRMIPNLGDGF